jgi:hypothetical protein
MPTLKIKDEPPCFFKYINRNIGEEGQIGPKKKFHLS